MNKILVTGGTGYIGSHTTVELINAGYDVEIIDDLSNSKIEVLDGIEKITGVKPKFHKIDLVDKEAVNNFFKTSSKFKCLFSIFCTRGFINILPFESTTTRSVKHIINC